MKYLCLVYLAEEKFNACPDSKCAGFAQTLQDSGHLIAAEPLHHVGTATSIRVRNNKVEVIDGPFAETKEHLAGFYLIEAKDINEALHLASKIPPAEHGTIEVRPVRQLAVG